MVRALKTTKQRSGKIGALLVKLARHIRKNEEFSGADGTVMLKQMHWYIKAKFKCSYETANEYSAESLKNIIEAINANESTTWAAILNGGAEESAKRAFGYFAITARHVALEKDPAYNERFLIERAIMKGIKSLLESGALHKTASGAITLGAGTSECAHITVDYQPLRGPKGNYSRTKVLRLLKKIFSDLENAAIRQSVLMNSIFAAYLTEDAEMQGTNDSKKPKTGHGNLAMVETPEPLNPQLVSTILRHLTAVATGDRTRYFYAIYLRLYKGKTLRATADSVGCALQTIANYEDSAQKVFGQFASELIDQPELLENLFDAINKKYRFEEDNAHETA